MSRPASAGPHSVNRMLAANELAARLQARRAHAGVVGLGYTGLPLAVEVARAGFRVTGIDTDKARVEAINNGRCYVPDVDADTLRELVSAFTLCANSDYADLGACDAISVCVPAPLRKTRDPNLTHVLDAVRTLAQHLRRGMLVVLESTTYPGTTEEAVLPILEQSGLRVGVDFFLCFSPERVDPTNREHHTRNIPKVIGGVTGECLRMGELYYGQVLETVVPVSSTLVAEMVKLLENTFRMVNIGLANETAILCDRMGIDVWEVIEAAATKPFGFMPFYPGPGLGGHCIPVDPHFLSWKSRQAGLELRLIQLASEINTAMPRHVVERIQSALHDAGKSLRGTRIHLLGVAYKRNATDTRESPALDIAALLLQMGVEVTYSNAHVPNFQVDGVTLEHQPWLAATQESDIAVVVTDHDGVDYQRLLGRAPLVLDTRNVLQGVSAPHLLRL